ncbi:Hint domain-containing protein [Yoonia sp.]|uniref:Hint domain-containing protein n=1 Tax=Yoonia sp. TaxID=2212373 RepID=UPI0025E4042F|nr:Hint domain-containing protein [Yoonia sp.]
MPLSLDGLIFGQIMPDNSGGTEFDTDGDGAASQEDEFVSVTNTTGAPLDISGWQTWSDSTGSGADDPPQDGLFHTFPPGTILAPGQTLWVINEITGTLGFAQEASEGGLESGTGSPNTNLLTEGSSGGARESIALVNPATGEYIVFNMSTNTPNVAGISGFTGTTLLGVIDGDAVQDDPGAGFSYQYDAATDGYIYGPAFVPCYASGTMIDTIDGPCLIETLRVGDQILTADHGPQPVLWTGSTMLDFSKGADPDQKPVAFKPGSMGPAMPAATLVVSPQHRMLMIDAHGTEVLAPAIGLTDRRYVRVKKGVKAVTYHHLLLSVHAVIYANGVPSESLYPGEQALDALPVRHKLAVLAHFPQTDALPDKARPFLSVGETQRAREIQLRPARAVFRSGRLGETCCLVKA